jgi:exonuclease VII large subunit
MAARKKLAPVAAVEAATENAEEVVAELEVTAESGETISREDLDEARNAIASLRDEIKELREWQTKAEISSTQQAEAQQAVTSLQTTVAELSDRLKEITEKVSTPPKSSSQPTAEAPPVSTETPVVQAPEPPATPVVANNVPTKDNGAEVAKKRFRLL